MIAFVLATVLLEALMPMTTIAKGAVSDVTEPREVVVRTEVEWTDVWRSHAGPGRETPAVDFGASMVIGVFLGARTTGGYAVEITSVEPDGAGVVVKYTESTPERGAMLAQVITAPFHLVSVATADGPVRFVRTEQAGR
jgi:hypothetical protein